MQRRLLIGMLALAFALGMSGVVSCSKNTIKSESSLEQSEQVAAAQPPAQRVVNEKAEIKENERLPAQPLILEDNPKNAQRLQPEDTRRDETAAGEVFPNELVLFEFDSSNLTDSAQESLKRKAQWLTGNPEVSVIIEGHCDERGTGAYNLKLGERRAQSAKAFLMDQGIPAVRLATVSYGEERPFADSHDESAWRLNRRANFVIEPQQRAHSPQLAAGNLQ